MRVALLTPEWFTDQGVGGIATYSKVIAETADRLGHEITVLAVTRGGRVEGSIGGGVRLVSVDVTGVDAEGVADRFLSKWRALVADGVRADFVEAPEYCGVGALIAEEGLVPMMTRLHTPLALLLERNGSGIYRDDQQRVRLEARQIRASSMLSSPSRWLAAEAVRMWQLEVPPVVVPNPYAVTAPQVSTADAQSTRPIRILYLGRLERRKGVFTLARALRLWFDMGARAEVTFVGGDTRWNGISVGKHLREILGPFAREPICRFAGQIAAAETSAFIEWADLVVLPSLFENFPYACLEAMAHAKPVLATSGSGFDDIIEHQRTGFLVEAGNAQQLMAALDRLGHDRATLAVVGRQGRLSLRRFDADSIVRRLFGLYAERSLRAR